MDRVGGEEIGAFRDHHHLSWGGKMKTIENEADERVEAGQQEAEKGTQIRTPHSFEN